ncbi:MAG: acyl carrier protein [Phycisphaerales bacterium]|nr:MAG: acyl carrier protein [Phycisphaerales bacterium]
MIDFESAKNEILSWVAETIQCEPDEVDTGAPLADLGIDSLDAVHLVATIESIIQTELPEDVIQRVRTLDDIFAMMRPHTDTAAA